MTGIADPVQVDHQSAGEGAEVNEVVPVAAVAGEARGLQAVDGAHFAGADQGDELLEAGRTVSPDPERPRSSSMTLMEAKPAALAASTRAYCRLWLSRLPTTCARVDWRI